ncbi:glycosyltransferase [Caulobacter sp. SL161]|uniref:glycosyltransferase n=1 Tax=Caulobacter sp. SL161 TaxID=2995156 RepID=UPI0022767270|nr:glycosyltransferase [Caulobacter sp. SL161]MCY1648415.1 glycosyltransferase [Caulobacter sp. SL161]
MSDEHLPRVTVITGYYNRGALLDRTLQSLLDQTYPNLEIIVFDDCSPDDTAERLKTYAARNDPRLKIIQHETNMGFTRGMINAISQASGEYIAVQGSGDVSTPDRIAEQAAVLNSRPEVGVVGSHYDNIVEQAGIARTRTPNANSMSLDRLVLGNVFSHGEVMFRRSAYDKAGGYRPEFKYCQDYDLWLRMIKVCEFYTVPRVLYNRYVQFSGVSYDPEKASIQMRYSILARRMALAPEVDAEAMFKCLSDAGPAALIPASDRELQRRIFKAALRSIVWGDGTQALRFGELLMPGVKRASIPIIEKLFSSSVFSFPRKIIYKYIGVSFSN